MNIVAIIAARYTSVRLKEKNLKLFCGRPLIEWLIRQVVYAKQITHSILVTDSYRMAKLAERYDVEVMIQPPDYPQFGTKDGGASANDFAVDQLGDRIKEIDGFIVGGWNPLCKVGDWDGMIDLFIERKPSCVGFTVPIPVVEYAIALSNGHYFTPPQIRNHRLMGWSGGALRTTTWEDEFKSLTGTEREKHELFYRLEGWQMHGIIDYQDQFDIAELLFRKHVLKDSETPYEDYFNGVGTFIDHGTCEGDIHSALKAVKGFVRPASEVLREEPHEAKDYDKGYPDQVRGVGPPEGTD
ncbi:hypothetical protein LCGC14_2320480 [marine sediment metagenome]|uniref:MobA-like NTP transferase domain-containing protein n=1 Tax=marine sediment metagenome TaxID=412755 RepID=A0A0F9EVG7_9ZZZZ